MNKKDIELYDGLLEMDVFGSHASRMYGYLLRRRVLDKRVLQVVSDARVTVGEDILVLKSRGLDVEGIEFTYVSKDTVSLHEIEGAFVELDWDMFDTEGQRLLQEYQDELRAGGITG